MYKRISFAAVTAFVAMGTSCQNVPPGTENPFEPQVWSQAHADRGNSGFNAVHNQYALPPYRKWSAQVGELVFSSPVIGPDGSIYIGNAAGEVVALNPDGSQQWRRKVDEAIVASPAVDVQTGDIFVIGQRPAAEGQHASRLYHLTPGAGLLSVSTEPLRTTASPKLWREFVIVPAGQKLHVYNQGLGLVAQGDTNRCFNLVCGSGGLPGQIIEIVGRLVGCVATLGITDIAGLTDFCPGFGFSASIVGALQEPSAAVVDQASLVGNPDQPIIVTSTEQCVTAFRFKPGESDPARRLQILWTRPLVSIDCDFDTVSATSPAVIVGGQVIVGDHNGNVRSFDLLTGTEVWKQKLSSGVQAPPVGFLRQIYVVTYNKLYTLDSDGDVMIESPLRGIGRNAAMGLDFLYVATTEGIHTFNLLPSEGFAFDGSITNRTHFGSAGVALANDGTLYVSTPTGSVVAYGTQGSLARQFTVPRLSWVTPSDGAMLASSPGQLLQVAVSAPGEDIIEGTVTLRSDVDGTLCEISTGGLTVACTTSGLLSVGTHTLTAFADDVSGGTNTAQITVHVIATPPVVSIAAPQEGGTFVEEAAIAFEATVTDVKETNFPPERLRWSSDIAGDLGTGFSLQRTLSQGDHTITATATDVQGVTGEASVRIQVRVNTAPTVSITSPQENDVFSDLDTITFTAAVTDPDEPDFPPDRVLWRSDIDGDLGTGLTLERMLSVGDHTITATATDAHGASGDDAVRIEVVVN